jgi:hypothetical protein
VRERLKIPFVGQLRLYARTLRQGVVSARLWHNSRAHHISVRAPVQPAPLSVQDFFFLPLSHSRKLPFFAAFSCLWPCL